MHTNRNAQSYHIHHIIFQLLISTTKTKHHRSKEIDLNNQTKQNHKLAFVLMKIYLATVTRVS